jgi:glucuronoarabinoxylan endo-1,4-beta-xylanase
MSNEPNVDVKYQSCWWSGAQMRDFLKHDLAPAFARDHVQAKLVVPEVSDWPKLEAWADPIMADPDSRRVVDIVASHQYDQTFQTQTQPKLPPATLLPRYAPAETFGKELWETEVSFIGGKPDPSIQWGLGTALLIHNAMAGAEVNAWHWWAILNSWKDNEGLADLAGDGYVVNKRLFALGNFSKFVRPGFHMTSATHSPAEGVYVTAFREAESGRFAIVAINDSAAEVALRFDTPGYDLHGVTPWVTSAKLDLAPQSQIPAGVEGFNANLAAKSVTTFAGLADQRPAK